MEEKCNVTVRHERRERSKQKEKHLVSVIFAQIEPSCISVKGFLAVWGKLSEATFTDLVSAS